MTTTPFSFHVTHDGKCLYSYEFVQLEQNEHLLTGILSAIRILYDEIFNEQLNDITLNNYRILTQRISGIDLYLIYTGIIDEAEILMMEILDQFLQEQIMSEIGKVIKTSVISSNLTARMDQILRDSGLPDYSVYLNDTVSTI